MTDTKKISSNKQRKVETVQTLKEKLEKAKSLFLTDYRGLTHQQLEQLRRVLKKVEAEFLVAKNTLLKLAFENSKIETTKVKDIINELKNPTATLLAYGDEIAPIKELATFIKSVQLPKIKLGFFGGKVVSENDFNTLSSLPSREILLSTLANRLQFPISGFHYALRWNLMKFATVLNNIKDKK